MLHVVTGAPCSGKTTFVNEHKAEGDIVIDLDALGVALGASEQWRRNDSIQRVALAAREAAIEAVGDADAWLIHTQPTPDQREGYGDAIFHDLDPGIDECLARAARDGRPEGTETVIRDFYAKQATPHGVAFSIPTSPARGAIRCPHGQEGASMSDATNTQAAGQQQEPHGTEQPVDFEAKYKEALAQSRKWEDRAKANKEKADKWDAYETEGMTEAEKATKRAAELQAELDSLKAEKQHATDASEVARETGAPVEYLQFCSSRDAMEQLAQKWQAEHGEQATPAAASAPSTRLIRPDGSKPANRDVFAAEFEKLL